MDWAYAVEHNRQIILRAAATLFALLGLETDEAPVRISLKLRRAVLRLLKPAESALRRLIIIAARDTVFVPGPSRHVTKGPGRKGRARRPVFRLFEPLVGFPRSSPSKNPPRVWSLDTYDKVFLAQDPAPRQGDGLVDGIRVSRRLQALKAALDDLPGQARRFVRLRARREKIPRLKGLPPLRPGHPPGHRHKPSHEIDEALRDCHWLAHEVLWPAPS